VFTFTWTVLRLPLLFLGLVGWATALFHIAPNRATPWRQAVPGALLTGLLWVVVLAFDLDRADPADPANPGTADPPQ